MKMRLLIVAFFFGIMAGVACADRLEGEFLDPPDSARPGVYWYFMNGNLSRQGMTADLESMKEVGLGNLVFLEVNVGVPRGPVDFMSEQWQELFAHAVHEAERLGIDITLGSGPGRTGSGGPWVKPEQAMQHLLFSVTETEGPAKFDAVLPIPEQRTTNWAKMYTDFYEDIVVYACPRREPIIADINEKALYKKDPYTSRPNVKEFLPALAKYDEPGDEGVISPEDIIDVSEYLDSEGRLRWDIPAGKWTIIRMVRRATCASTRPAPEPGLGLECDKFDSAALDHHLANYYDKLLKKVGRRKGKNGWTTMHIDSWEMGAQNWTKNQGDWAFCMGINRFVYHTFAHKPLGDEFRPGMAMGPYGVHWDRSIKYYSGIATYRKTFDLPHESGERIHLDLGTVHDIARVRLNGKDLGVVWCAPWRVDITDGVKPKGNALEVEIANRWPNRLFGDQQAPDKGARTVKWNSGFLGGREYKTGRYTFAATGGPNRLLPSGLLGPVTLLVDSAVGGDCRCTAEIP